MSSDENKPEQNAAPPADHDESEEEIEEEEVMADLERDLAEPHVPLDGAPPEHWKHVDSPLSEEERLKIEAAKEEHQERMARGHFRGKI